MDRAPRWFTTRRFREAGPVYAPLVDSPVQVSRQPSLILTGPAAWR
jgi:hypothetical protein